MIKDWIMLLETLLEWEAWPNGHKMMKCDVPKCDVQNGKVPKEREETEVQKHVSTGECSNAVVWTDILHSWCWHFCSTDRPSVNFIRQKVGFVAVFAVKWGCERPSCETFAAIRPHLRPNIAFHSNKGHNALCGRSSGCSHTLPPWPGGPSSVPCPTPLGASAAAQGTLNAKLRGEGSGDPRAVFQSNRVMAIVCSTSRRQACKSSS